MQSIHLSKSMGKHTVVWITILWIKHNVSGVTLSGLYCTWSKEGWFFCQTCHTFWSLWANSSSLLMRTSCFRLKLVDIDFFEVSTLAIIVILYWLLNDWPHGSHLDNLEECENFFSQGILNKLEKSGNFTQNTGKMSEL